eukprot:scaffold4990_cov176-Amphora_coffeaeformis.AAC.8
MGTNLIGSNTLPALEVSRSTSIWNVDLDQEPSSLKLGRLCLVADSDSSVANYEPVRSSLSPVHDLTR